MPGHRHPDPSFATTVAHGFAVLQCFSVDEPALSNKDLAARTGLSKPTITRLTYTLAARGLLVYDAQLRRYRLGSTVLTIGQPVMASLSVRQVARAAMEALARDVGGAVSIGMRDRTHMVYVETACSHALEPWRPDIGARVPMWMSAIGRAWLAAAPAHQREEAWDCIRAAHPDAWARHAEGIAADEAELQARGFCTSRSGWRPELAAVAVPMRVPQEGTTLVFNCEMAAGGASPQRLVHEVGPALVELVRRLEAQREPS